MDMVGIHISAMMIIIIMMMMMHQGK